MGLGKHGYTNTDPVQCSNREREEAAMRLNRRRNKGDCRHEGREGLLVCEAEALREIEKKHMA